MSSDDQLTRVEITFDAVSGEDFVFRNAWIPNYQVRRVGCSWFLSNASGEWQVLNDDELSALTSVAIPISLFRRLESRHLILTARSTATYFAAYERWTTPHFRHPVHHIIIATLRCNLACTYCHAAVVPPSAGKSYDLTFEKAEAILRFASQSVAPVQSFEFQGGESLLNRDLMLRFVPRIRETYEELGREVYISLQTNATLLDDAWMEFFRKHYVRVGTSLDGPSEVHDAQRRFVGGQPTHARVAQKAERYGVPVLPTITRNSLPMWKRIVDEQLTYPNAVVAFQNVYPINSAKRNWEELGISAADFLDKYLEVVSYLRSRWVDGDYPIERRVLLALKKLATGRDVDFADFGNPCGMVHSQIVYHTNGDVYTCDEGRDFPEFKLGNVETESYDDVVFGARMRTLKSLSLPNDPECLTCAYRPYCSTCPVYDRAATGELKAVHAGTDKCLQTKAIFDTVIGWIAESPDLLDTLCRAHGITRSTERG